MRHFFYSLEYFINWKTLNIAIKWAGKHPDSDNLRQTAGFLAQNHNNIIDAFVKKGLADGTIAFFKSNGKYTLFYNYEEVEIPYDRSEVRAGENRILEEFNPKGFGLTVSEIYTIQHAKQTKLWGKFLKWLPTYDPKSIYASTIVKDIKGNYSAPVSLVKFYSPTECSKKCLSKALFVLRRDMDIRFPAFNSAHFISKHIRDAKRVRA